MAEVITMDQVLGDLIGIIEDLTSDWEFDGEITSNTKLFFDLGFESIDAVALGTALEGYCGHSLPFAEFLTKMGEQGVKEMNVGKLADFVYQNLNSSKVEEG